MADRYEYGAADETPHIHAYNSGCHLKVAGGERYNLVIQNVRATQASLNIAFDKVRADYPNVNNHIRIGLLIAMQAQLENVPKHHSDIIDRRSINRMNNR